MARKLAAGLPGQSSDLVGGVMTPPYRLEKHFSGNKKPPELLGSRDESMIRGTTLLISRREIPSDSSKSYPGNGGDRVPLLRRMPVYRTDSGTRPPSPPYRLSPAADSLQLWNREDFSFDVFAMYTFDIKAQTAGFVNRFV